MEVAFSSPYAHFVTINEVTWINVLNFVYYYDSVFYLLTVYVRFFSIDVVQELTDHATKHFLMTFN